MPVNPWGAGGHAVGPEQGGQFDVRRRGDDFEVFRTVAVVQARQRAH